MTAASANVQHKSRGPDGLSAKVANAVTMYAGVYAALASRDHASVGGYVTNMLDDTAGLIPLGFVDQYALGDTSASPVVEAAIKTGGVIHEDVTITDDAGDITDTGRLVYLVDNQTFSLSRPATIGCPVGITVRFKAVNTFDVYFFSFGEMLAMQLAGGNRIIWNIGGFFAEGGATNADALKGIVCPYHGYITDYFLICGSAPADADVAGPVTLEVDGTDLNFASANPTIAAADTLGLKISGTGALTAVAVHEGSLLDVETDFTAAGTVGDGFYNVYVDIELQPGV